MENGNMVLPMDLENLTITTGGIIKEIGSIIKDQGMGSIRVEQGQNILDSGKMIKCMDLEFNLGQMVQNLMEFMSVQQDMGKVNING